MEQTKKRVWLIDEVRGLAILLMVVYHFFYDIVVLFGVNIPFFYSAELNFIRDLFAGLFIFISGTACRFSKNNLKRGVQCFALGMVMTYVTAIALPHSPILFGILHLLGVCMLLFAFTERLLDKVPLWVGIVSCVLLFALTCGIRKGFFGIGGLFELPLPAPLLDSGLFFPFGVLSSGFSSSDYFPLLPWLFVFLAGTFVGVPVKEGKMPDFFYRRHIPPLAFIGRHTIWVYLLHQPVLMGICTVVFSFIR